MGIQTASPLRPLVSAGFAILALAGGAVAQVVGGQWETRFQFDGSGTGASLLGTSVSGAGDVDADGVEDIIVGMPYWTGYTGAARVYSGATGAMLWQFQGAATYALFGQSVAGAGDIDGDGHGDVAVGAPGLNLPGGPQFNGSVYVYSGADGSTLRQFNGSSLLDEFGTSVAAAGDVDADGITDIIVGAPYEGLGNGGSASVYSGASGVLIWKVVGTSFFGLAGTSVATAGDVDGDGHDDFLFGAPGADFGGLDTGSAFLHSGATGLLLRRLDGTQTDSEFGYAVSGAGDVDGDGTPDVAVGIPHENSATSGGAVDVYSGATGTRLWRFQGQQGFAHTGAAVAGAGDVDGDGHADLLIGAPEEGAGSWDGAVYLVSGDTGQQLHRFTDAAGGFSRLGKSVAGLGDLDDDGFPELAAGAPSGSRAYVWAYAPFLDLGADTLSYSSGAALPVNLEFPASEALLRYAVLLSLSGAGPSTVNGLQVPLTQDAIFQRSLGNPGLLGDLDAAGQAQLALRLHRRTSPAIIGRTLHLAAATFDPGTQAGRLSSVARSVQILP